MRLLLDTHVLIWTVGEDQALGQRALESIVDQANDVFVSPASVWEIAIKVARGTLELAGDLNAAMTDANFIELPITFAHAELAGALPPHHKDPFDRVLIAQAQAEGLVLVTADQRIPRYGVRTMPATR